MAKKQSFGQNVLLLYIQLAKNPWLKPPVQNIASKTSMAKRSFIWCKLTHYQTKNFRLFQTERVCRRQFQI